MSGLPPALQVALLVLLAAVPLALVAALYRYELRLVPRTAARALLGLRIAAGEITCPSSRRVPAEGR
jgi:hypothetical protein